MAHQGIQEPKEQWKEERPGGERGGREFQIFKSFPRRQEKWGSKSSSVKKKG
jgi:hypothetical protein